MKNHTDSFSKLFNGLKRAYGTYEVNGEKAGKKIGKAKTVQEAVTTGLWEGHLEGNKAIGITPIRDDNTAGFGAIDIDDYKDFDVKGLLQKIKELGLPLVPTYSKSRGVHLWLFLNEPVSAALVRDKLRKMAVSLGHGTAEVFPKQDSIVAEKGDIGNWINMPYFGDSRKLIYQNTNKEGSLENFIETATNKQVTREWLLKWDIAHKEDFNDGPPCLQHIATSGFPNGTRNVGLYNIGVYLKKSDPYTWQELIVKANFDYMDPPLQQNEVNDLIKSLRKKDYQYTCKQPPCKEYCNQPMCRARKYGVGSNAGMPVLMGLTKIDTVPPVWFADVEGGGRIELMTEDLQSQNRFQRVCMNSLNTMPSMMKNEAWTYMVQELLQTVNTIEVPRDATPIGMLEMYIERYCTQRAQAVAKDEIILGKPYTEDGWHIFQIHGLLSFLDRHKFTDMSRAKITAHLRDMGAVHNFFVTRNRKGVNAWMLPEFTNAEELTLPKSLNPEEAM